MWLNVYTIINLLLLLIITYYCLFNRNVVIIIYIKSDRVIIAQLLSVLHNRAARFFYLIDYSNFDTLKRLIEFGLIKYNRLLFNKNRLRLKIIIA